MSSVIFYNENNIPAYVTDSPTAIVDELTYAILSLGDIEVIEPRLNKMRHIYVNYGLEYRAKYLKLIKLPLNQDFIDKVNSSECKQHIKKYLEHN